VLSEKARNIRRSESLNNETNINNIFRYEETEVEICPYISFQAFIRSAMNSLNRS